VCILFQVVAQLPSKREKASSEAMTEQQSFPAAAAENNERGHNEKNCKKFDVRGFPHLCLINAAAKRK